MKKTAFVILYSLMVTLTFAASSWIRVNQIGYLQEDIKVAVWISKDISTIKEFQLIDITTGNVVYTGTNIIVTGKQPDFLSSARLNFSDFKTPGTYNITANGITSVLFKIGDDVYLGASEFPLKYMRQQRCGYNPFLKDSCHVHDGITVGDPEGMRNGLYYNTTGGWHDASDYLQYVTTSANSVYQMLFAYSQHPEVFADNYQVNGDEGSNGIPDILDEAKWGLDWLVKMNPDSATYFNQIADDRDHSGFILPTKQKVNYGWGEGKERPVYLVSPEPQGLQKHKNRSTGMASTLGKYASSFTLGAKLLSKYYPEYATMLIEKAKHAYQKGAANPGVSQTAPGGAPYFYEEDNWADDMQLAAIEMYSAFGKKEYLEDAVNYGRLEPVTPWMGADSARHYQWYPFINLGNYHLAVQNNDMKAQKEFIRNMHTGLWRVKERANGNAFLHGIPFIWCSNNLTVAFITQCRLYHEITGDDSFLEIETAMRDWLFGVNPWGASMIVGYPANGDTPEDPHSSFTYLHNMPITGGIVDGPIYSSIYNSLIGVYLAEDDEYESFQSDVVVYHDDYADYSTNEPTMDGTASMCYYMGYLSKQAQKEKIVMGGVIRGDKNKKKLSLVFTGHEFADGSEIILRTLEQNNVKGTFFLTGDFYRNYPLIVKELQDNGHYMAPHSDKHLLYADWTKRDSTLVTKDEFTADVQNNYTAMTAAGLKIELPKYYMPPYEWYNQEVCDWAKELDVQIVNYTPGTTSNADYTTPGMKSYRSSDQIYNAILSFEEKESLNGVLMLIHIGTHPDRIDKLYNKLDNLIKEIEGRGYELVRVDDLLK